jgi:hypothetical protein
MGMQGWDRMWEEKWMWRWDHKWGWFRMNK